MIFNHFLKLMKFLSSSYVRISEFKSILEKIPRNSTLRLLDVACGDGMLEILLLKKNPNLQILGIDFADQEINKCQKLNLLNSKFMSSPAEKLPVPNRYFDIIVSNCALEHFSDQQNAIREMSRSIKDGGTLILTMDSFNTSTFPSRLRKIHAKKFYVTQYFTEKRARALLKKENFEISEIRYYINSGSSIKLFTWMLRKNWSETGQKYLLAFGFLFFIISSLSDFLIGRRDAGLFLFLTATKKVSL